MPLLLQCLLVAAVAVMEIEIFAIVAVEMKADMNL